MSAGFAELRGVGLDDLVYEDSPRIAEDWPHSLVGDLELHLVARADVLARVSDVARHDRIRSARRQNLLVQLLIQTTGVVVGLDRLPAVALLGPGFNRRAQGARVVAGSVADPRQDDRALRRA